MTLHDAYVSALAFANNAPFILIKWALLVCLLVVLYVLFYSENFKLPKGQANDVHFQSVLNLAKKRGWYALVLFAMYIFTVIAYDITIWQKKPAQGAADKPANAAAALPAGTTTPPKANAPVTANGSNDVVSIFNDVTVFSEKNAQAESYMDQMKQRYEPVLITYFILEHCKAADTEAFITLQDKILDDLQKVSGNADNLARFIDASRGSYEEMYSNYDCTKSDLTTMKERFDANIQLYKAKPENTPAPAQNNP